MYGRCAGSWIYIGPRDPPGHVRDVRGLGASRRETSGVAHAHRGARRPGRRAAAAGPERGRRALIEVDPAPCAAPLDIGLRPPTSSQRCPRRRERPGKERPSDPLVGNAAEIEPAWPKAGERFDVGRTRRRPTTRWWATRRSRSRRDAAPPREHQPEGVPGSDRSMAAQVRAMLAFHGRRVVFEYGNNRAPAKEAGVDDAFD